MTPNIETIIKDHVTLSVRCLDRIYLPGTCPSCETSGGLCYFLRDHLGHPIPSPALFRPMHDRFVKTVETFATDHAVPFIKFESGQDKDAIVATHRARSAAGDGVVVIGVAQEKARAFKAHKRTGPQGGVTFDFTRQSVAVNHYYFYVQDPEWGPAFVKIGTYVPYPIKLCLNGHEWVKQHLRRAGSRSSVSTMASSRAPIPRASKRSAISSAPAICSSSLTVGPTACRGRCTSRTVPPISIIASRCASSKSVSRRSSTAPYMAVTSSKPSFARISIWGDPIASGYSFRVASRAGRPRLRLATGPESSPTASSPASTLVQAFSSQAVPSKKGTAFGRN